MVIRPVHDPQEAADFFVHMQACGADFSRLIRLGLDWTPETFAHTFTRAETVQYPEEKPYLSPRYRGRIVLTRDPDDYKGDAKANLDIITKMGLPRLSPDDFLAAPPTDPPALIIDALFGTGLSRPVEGQAASLIGWINHTRAKHAGALQVLAADIPSGLDATSGEPLSESVIRADRTVTFAALKPGLSAVQAQPFVGETHIAPIGAPRQLLDQLATRITPPTDPTRG